MVTGHDAVVGMGLYAKRTTPPQDVTPADDPLPGLDPVAPFPLEVLPPTLRMWVEQAAAALPCPPDFLAVPALVGAGIALGAYLRIEVKPGWREGPQLFAAIVADPGTKKSPALRAALAPLWDRQAVGWPAAAADGDSHPVQCVTTDTTTEGLIALHALNPHGLVVAPDELTAWVGSFGEYKRGGGSDRAHWLSLWNGHEVIVNRKGHAPLAVGPTCVGVVGAIPPQVLDRLAPEATLADGLTDRILWAWPDPVPLRWTEAGVPPDVQTGYADLITRLWTLGGTADAPRVVGWTDAARGEWVRWMTRQYAAQATVPQALRGAWAKFDGLGARLTLIVHGLRVAAGEAPDLLAVDPPSVTAAWALADYFLSHARRVTARWPDTRRDRQCLRVVTHLQECGGSASVREIQRQQLAGLRTALDVRAVFQELTERGYGTVHEASRHSVVFTLHPTPDTRGAVHVP